MAGSQRTDAWKAGKRRGYRRWLCRVFLPDGFGAEDECDEFAGGGFAAIGFGGVVGGAVDFGGGVVNGNGEADALQHSQVGEVIAEEGEVRFLDAGFVQDGFEGAIL